MQDDKPITWEELASLRALCDKASQGDRRFRQVRDHCDEYDAFLMPLDLHIPDSISEGVRDSGIEVDKQFAAMFDALRSARGKH